MGSKYSHVFSPIRIRGIDFKNRISLAPTTPVLSTWEGLVTPQLVNWMRMFARGGASVLYLGNCSIDLSENQDQSYQLDLANEVGTHSLAAYADMCKEYGCHASLEINHGGEGVAYETFNRPGWSSSSFISEDEVLRAKRNNRSPIPCQEMTKQKIDEVVDMFGKAAARMKRAGMDIVMVHGGHGNLISQFTSPKFNHRTDEYGGSTENRARFAIEVCQSIRKYCGEDFVIEYRCSGDEEDPEGMHIDETIELVKYLKPHIDILHVSAGLHSDPRGPHRYYRNWCPNFLMDRCFNMHYARDIKKAHPDVIVSTVGAITSLDYAEEIISNGWADFVSMCRPLMADPDMPVKYAEDRPEDRRPCLRCDACSRHIMVPKHISCAVNPMCGMTSVLPDGVVPTAKEKKRVAIVGGGPAGIQALQTLLDRGHDVTLYEKSDKLGGHIIEAAIPSFKTDVQDYLGWMLHTAKQCQDRGAKILLNTEATKELLDKEKYDALIIAPGADPIIPKVPGIDKKHVHWAPDAEAGKCEVGDNIVIIGGSSVGMEAGLDFSLQGKNVSVIEMLPEGPAQRKLHASSGPSWKEFVTIYEQRGIPVHYGHRLMEVKDECIVCENTATGESVTIPCDTVLLAVGMRPRFEIADSMRHCAPETSVYIVGDAFKSAGIFEAVNDTFRACIHI
ncbi:MAG: FAD-dependent oxidoreductase [Oscillospiraceae bacterium]|nr:FAD-dependent oxidoreductase [Oscillospiraceae bacterium]